MKTAEEILKLRPIASFDQFHRIEEFVIDAMKDYAKQKCAEQRQMCADNAKVVHHCGVTKINNDIQYFQSGCDNLKVSKQSILNAPTPELK